MLSRGVVASLVGLSWVMSACGGDTGHSAIADDPSTSSGGQGATTGSPSQTNGISASSGGDAATASSPSQVGGTSTTSATVTSTSGQGAVGGQGGSDSGSATGGARSGGAGGGGVDEEEPDLSSLDLPRFGCVDDGDRSCYDTNQRVQLICYDNTPQVYGVCPPGERCDTRPDNLGECEPVLPECVGQTPYVGLCVGDTYVECGVDLLDRAYEELCTDRCVPQAQGADCIHAGCGDGTLTSGEACDDGNNTSGDGCSAACAWDPPLGVTLEEVVGFGQAVAMSGDTIAVSGSRLETGQPEIFVFRQDGIAWRLEALLGVSGDSRATNQEADAIYMGELALDGDTLAVAGAGPSSYENEAIFIYQRTGTTWELQAKVTPQVPGVQGRDETVSFGSSLSLSEETLVVGAEYDHEQAPYAGAAYVYRREGSAWQSEQKLFAALSGGASDAEEGATFGSSVAVSGDRIVVGALAKEGATFQTGAGYVYLRQGSSWSPEARFMPPQPSVITYDTGGPQCGSAVAIAGDTIVVGCRYDWEEGPPNSGEEPGKYAGSAYVLERGTSGWAQAAKLGPLPGVHPSDDKSIAEFGQEVAISADANLVVVASPSDYTYGAGGGSVHVFRRGGATWTAQQKLVAIPPRGADVQSGFGASVALSGENVLVGAPSVEPTGRAFLYQFVEPSWELRLKLHAVEP